MSILRILKKPEQEIERLSLKTMTVYLGIFSLIAMFMIGFLLGVLVS